MINRQLLDPESIVIVGGSNDIRKPGGKVLKNIIDNGYSGSLYAANPKEDEVQGIKSYRDLNDLPDTDLAVLAVAARHCVPAMEILAKKKKTRAFIILSAGFAEESEEGAALEKKITGIVDETGSCLIGPNCIGMMNARHASVFTTPVPKLHPGGVDFISGSGAMAVYTMEAGFLRGLTFGSVFSVGNSAQIGVEDVIMYMDENFDPAVSSRFKLLYMESIKKPEMLLRHASSLIRKGCRIAAIKSGSSEAGSRAATSHTGALAGSDLAVDALFRKAGIIRCYSREELITVAGVFLHKQLNGKRFAIITHAGGSAVMLTDTLSDLGMEVPEIEGPDSDNLLKELFPGSSVANPIDFLATGNAEQLGKIIDYCENRFENIDGMVVIFGSPGLAPVYDVYDVLDEKMTGCSKPVFPVLPSVVNAGKEIGHFLAKGRFNFTDEVVLGRALAVVYHAPAPASPAPGLPVIDTLKVREIIEKAIDGYLPPESVVSLLDAAGIPRAEETVVRSSDEASSVAGQLGFPVVMKVVGPVHKSDAGGISLNVADPVAAGREFERLMRIPGTDAVLIQPMLSGTELFAGAKYEPPFGHLVLCGLGGIFVEVLKDVAAGIAPLGMDEAVSLVRGLKGYRILEGARGTGGVDIRKYAEVLVRLSALVKAAPEIYELDLNPLMGTGKGVTAVDARIRVEKG